MGGGRGRRERREVCNVFSFSVLQVANAGDDVLIFYNDHAFSTLQRLMKEDRDDAVSLTGQLRTANKMYDLISARKFAFFIMSLPENRAKFKIILMSCVHVHISSFECAYM